MWPRPACHYLVWTVPPLARRHGPIPKVWRALLGHCKGWMTAPGACYPPQLVLEQLTGPAPRVRHALNRASAKTDRLAAEVLDITLEPLRVLYPQADIPPACTSNCLARLRLQRCVEALHVGGVAEQCLTLRNRSPAQGEWYLHQLLFLSQAAPENRRRDPYASHPEGLGAQSFPQPPLPALSQGQGREVLLQGPPLHTATAVQQRGRRNADRAEPNRTNCGVAAWTVACRHVTRDTTRLRIYRRADHTAPASTVAAVTMGTVAVWPAHLLPHVPHQDARPRRPAATHKPTAPPTAEQLYAVAAALLADGGESFIHHNGPALMTGSIQGPQHDAPDPWCATLCERNRI